MFFSKNKSYDSACQAVHQFITHATKELVPDKFSDVRLVRKKMSVFTYGVCAGYVEDTALDKDELYYRYLLKGGLKKHRARVVVERTGLEFKRQDFAKGIFEAGYEFVVNSNQDKKINSPDLNELLSNKN